MKTYTILAIAALTLLALPVFGQSATQHWKGAGTVSLPNGQTQGTYQVDVTVQQISTGVSNSTTKVTLPGGQVETITQTVTKSASGGYAIDSSIGKGGGACYGENLCEFYIEDASCGKAVAITVVNDADGSRRDLITVLQNGKAVSILSEKLVQVK